LVPNKEVLVKLCKIIRAIGVIDEDAENENTGKEGILSEVGLEVQELESKSGKTITKVKLLFEKN